MFGTPTEPVKALAFSSRLTNAKNLLTTRGWEGVFSRTQAEEQEEGSEPDA